MSRVPGGDLEEVFLCAVCRLSLEEGGGGPCRQQYCAGCVRCGSRVAAGRRRDLLLRALDAASALRARLAAELAAPAATHHPRLDRIVRAATTPLDFHTIRHALADPTLTPEPTTEPEPLLLLANFCTATLFARGLRSDDDTDERKEPTAGIGIPLTMPMTTFPLFYFEVEVDGAPVGRVVVEVRTDVAPRMARNFAALTTGELGVGYRGCSVFQCWERESVITGDFELNNGRGGRSAFGEGHFMPDDSRLAAVRGAVGMRRSQRRRDHLGLVGSQFRIVLREMRGFTAIFGSVVEGLELVDRLSRTGDGAGKPSSSILIASCGKLN